MRSGGGAMLVVVHGPPGSGKSTLARALGQELGLPVFDRDDFKDLIFDALGWSDRNWSIRVGEVSWDLLLHCVDRLARSGVSLIAESNFRPAHPGVAKLRRLCAEVEIDPIEIHCMATPAALWRRFDQRRHSDERHPGHAGFEDRDAFLADLDERPHGRLGLAGRSLEVDTTGAWPDPISIATWIREPASRLVSIDRDGKP